MDKMNKFQQPNLKGAASDAKKSQDVNSSKFFPKSSRRRESTNANSNAKYDQQRKSNAQKTKSFDKRPKPKGHYHGSAKEDSKVVEDESAELGSVMVQGSKKQNLNHLLNFYYAPRDVHSGWSYGRSSYNSYNNRCIERPLKFNKERFLQANCQFVVTAKGDYSLYLNNPDALVDWKLVQQIRVHSSENLVCPICLFPPVAGKMTRCGHVYCWPCILHVLALPEKAQRTCPICLLSVHKSDLKSVMEIIKNILNIGDHISFRLMRREKGSLLAVPVEDINSCPPTTFLSVAENSCQPVFSKLLLANDNDIMDIIETERIHLKLQLSDYPNSTENCYIEQALDELSTREKLLLEGISQPEVGTPGTTSPVENTGMKNQNNLLLPKEEKSPKGESNSFEEVDNSSSLDQANYNLIASSDLETSSSSKKFHYFYQAEGGQNVYLHAMNIKMLEMQYGSLEKCPRLISGKLIEKEVGSFTEDLRRRMRYLCHLPLTSQFELAEIDLQPPIVGKDVIAHFEGQMLSRQKKRKRREKEERKREKKINEEENKRMGKYPTVDVHIESRRHFPQFQPDPSEGEIPSPPESVTILSAASSPSVCSFDEIASAAATNGWPAPADHGPSFAQMLQTSGSKKMVAWPSLRTSRKSESDSSNAGGQITNTDPIDPELVEYVAPVYNRSLGDALAEALENSDLLCQGSKSTDNVTGGKKKKKKGKTTVLFATNMARSS